MADDLQAILRRANEAIGNAAERLDYVKAVRMRGEPRSEQKRYESMVLYHAERLGEAIAELATWLERGTGTEAIAPRQPRGRERSPRAIRQ